MHYGPINPTEAREIFIRGRWWRANYDTRAPFFEHNRKLVDEVEELEHKARRQDVLVDEERIFAFYDALIPAGHPQRRRVRALARGGGSRTTRACCS